MGKFVLIVIISLVVMICTVSATSSLENEQIDQLCKQISHKSHQLFSPFRCKKDGEEFGLAGKKFKAAHPEINTATLNPVVLLPGLGGSGLEAQIHKNSSKAWYCFKNLDWFRIWFAVQEILVQPCWMDNLNVDYDPSTGFYNNTPGVSVRPADFGGIHGVAYLDYKLGIPVPLTGYYENIVKSLESVGYEAGKNLHGAPYDWRLPATYIGSWYAQLKALIESTYTSNGNLPVHIITHSMGGPTGLYFLNQMDQAWKDQYVASFIPIAGPWTGAPNALRALISGDNFGLSVFGIDILSKTSLRDVARQAGGIVELIPNTDLNTNSVSFVNDGTMNYTIPDFPNLFSKMGSPATAAVYKTTQNIVQSLTAPKVPAHCLYGYGVPTEVFYTYPNGNFNEDPIIDDSNLGDGTVPLYSLQECNNWVDQQTQPVNVQQYNLGHSEVLDDEEVIQYILSVVTNTL